MSFATLLTRSQQAPFTPPVLNVYQASYGGLTFGGLTAGGTYQFVAIPTGSVDMPNVQSSDTQKPLDQGEQAGVDVSGGRDVNYQQIITATTAAAMEAARQALGGVMAVSNTELPFYLQLNGGQFACMCRPRKHTYKIDINSVLPFNAGVTGGDTVLSTLHATDPRWYAMPIRVAGPVGLPVPAGGLGPFPVTPNFTFGGGSIGGFLSAYNNGLFEMRPVVVFAGPCTNPMITNQSLVNNPSVGFTITLNAGDLLTVDMGGPSALYLPAGASVGQSVMSREMGSNTWWNLAPSGGPEGIGGPNNLVFTSTDGTQVAGTCTVYSADAYAAL